MPNGVTLPQTLSRVAVRLRHSAISALSHRLRLAELAVLSIAVLVALTTAGSAASAGCTARSLYVVAHPDDSILFQAPDLVRDAKAGNCLETIFITAGDAGYDAGYWQSREDGTMAAYAAMVGAPDSWNEGQVVANGHVIDSETLSGRPNISLLFMNLPDGADDGSGFAADNFESLMKLWQGSITTMHPVDGSASYTKASLTSTLAALVNQFQPNAIQTQDLIGNFSDVDHTDHHATAYLTRDAQRQYTAPHTLTSYVDSPIWEMPVNLSAADTQMKENIWFVYAPYDKAVCQNVTSCQDRYAYYWSRQYTNSTSTLPTAIHSTSPSAAWIGETMTVSGNGFLGATGVSFNGTNATSFSVDSDTQITVTVPAGATSGPLTVTGPAGTGTRVGSFTILPPPPPPIFNGGFTPASGAVGAVVTLTGSGFTGAGGVAFNGTGAAFHVDSDTQITAVVPSGAGGGPITVSNAGGSGTSASSFTVSSPTPIGTNVARLATPTASSQNSADSQTAPKAIDGFTDGCCGGDYTHEWASQGEGVGAWLNLGWASAQRLDSITLYDRPNPNDQITSATITFSDGSSVPVGSLPNDGSPLTVTFVPRMVTSLRLTVTGVSATTGNVGLAELKAYTAPPSTPIVSNLSPNTAAAGAAVTISGYGFQGATDVRFGGTSTTFNVNSDTQITATVPAGATSGTITVTGPSGTGTSAGSFTVIPPPPPPVFNGGFAPASGAIGAVVTLTGTGFTGATGVAFAGTSAAFHVDSDTQITAVVPSGAVSGSITVSNAGGSSTGTSSFTVSASTPIGTNVARLATASASSQNSQFGQTADKAIDGFTDGCCNGDYTHEWASQKEGVGAWLNLAWGSAQTVDALTLYDRPNTNDQITSATITFSNGSSVQVGSLPNDGSPLTVTFMPRTVTSLRFTVTGVSASTGNVGLGEIKGYTAPPSAPMVSNPVPDDGCGGGSGEDLWLRLPEHDRDGDRNRSGFQRHERQLHSQLRHPDHGDRSGRRDRWSDHGDRTDRNGNQRRQLHGHRAASAAGPDQLCAGERRCRCGGDAGRCRLHGRERCRLRRHERALPRGLRHPDYRGGAERCRQRLDHG